MKTNQSQTAPAEVRENIMGTMEINPLLLKLSIPMMISMLVQALYNVVDSVFVSHVSESALTAVSLAFSLQNVMIAVGVGTGVGVNALLSKSLGEKNQSRANATAENGIFLSLCSFAVFFVIGLTCMKPYFYAQTSDPVIAQQGIRYLSVCSIFSLGIFTQTMGEKLLAATGRTQLSMISQLVVEGDSLMQAMNQYVKTFISDNYENVLGPSVFMMLCSSLPYPIMTPQIDDIIKDAPYSFKDNKLVREFLSKARENMKLIEEHQRLEQNASTNK